MSLERKFGMPDTIAIASDQGAEIGIVSQVTVERIEAKHHIGGLTRSIRRLERGHPSAVSDDRRLQAIVFQSVNVNRGSVRGLAKWLLRDHRFCFQAHPQHEAQGQRQAKCVSKRTHIESPPKAYHLRRTTCNSFSAF